MSMCLELSRSWSSLFGSKDRHHSDSQVFVVNVKKENMSVGGGYGRKSFEYVSRCSCVHQETFFGQILRESRRSVTRLCFLHGSSVDTTCV